MKKVKLEYEYVKSYVESQGFELLSSEYINAHSKLELKCNNGHIFSINWNSFQSGHRCMKCSKDKARIAYAFSFEHVKEYIQSFGYKLLSTEYINNRQKLSVVCDKGHKYETSFSTFKSGSRCRKCSGSMKHTIEEVKDYANSFGYDVLSEEYISNKHKIKYVCPKGHVFDMKPNHFTTGTRCPKCRESKGEGAIEQFLILNNIEYIKQFKTGECKNIQPLPFDFYLINLDIFIEYDGELHYKDIDFYGGEKTLKYTQMRDEIKTSYCNDNAKVLIRIPYWEFENIENILKEKLNLN